MSWIRKINDTEELIIATDSRLRFGCAWDSCPKIFVPERKDFALAFAGDTMYAYPFIIQYLNVLQYHLRMRSRALDINHMVGHFTRIMNKMFSYITDLPVGEVVSIPEFKLIFAGFSWSQSCFRMWEIKYEPSQNRFVKGGLSSIMKNQICLIGDYIPESKKKIYNLMKEKGKKPGDKFDMEPFEVLRDIIRNNESHLIGGPPQIVKIYRHINVLPFGVFWPNKETKKITLMGRTLLDYEMIENLILDPDTFETHSLKIADEQYQREWDNGLPG